MRKSIFKADIIFVSKLIPSMSNHVASYFRHGHTMSFRARKAHKNNEHPITYWVKELALDKDTIQKMLTYAGIHHTGVRAMRTRFYRLANLKNEGEYRRFFKMFHSIPASKKKFIHYMADILQEKIDPGKNRNSQVRSSEEKQQHVKQK